MNRTLAVAAFTAYVAVCVAANLATNAWGLRAIGFGLMATAGTVFAGAAFLIRDLVQDSSGKTLAVLAILTGSALSWMLGAPQLAVASCVAFLASELADLAVYTPLRGRGWFRAVTASQIVGAVIDTYLFLWLAGFPVTVPIVAGQIVGKTYVLVAAVAVKVYLIRRNARREHALLREPVNH